MISKKSRIGAFIFFTSLAWAFFVPAADAGSHGSCIDCHEKLERKSPLEHNYRDWKTSMHAKVGVNCENCHGGNPYASEKVSAHAGMFPATDPRSLVSFNKLPYTCGACHEPEFQAFSQSAHFHAAGDKGGGPNCATCHGTMANRVLGPDDVEHTCKLCHKNPTGASAALTQFNQVSASLDKLDEALNEALARDIDVARQEDEYEKALTMYADMIVNWHKFNIQEINHAAQDVIWRTAHAITQIKVSPKKDQSK